MIGRRRYGRVGLVAMPYYVVFELLGPVIELLGLVAIVVGLGLGVLSIEFALLFGAVAVLCSVALSVAALLVEEISFHRYRRWRDLGIGVAAAIAENLGYRQLHAWWRLCGLVAALRGTDNHWGAMPRSGFDEEVAGDQRSIGLAGASVRVALQVGSPSADLRPGSRFPSLPR